MKPLITVFCTHCGAAPGQPCRSVLGRVIVTLPHMRRFHAAGLAGLSDREKLDAYERYEEDAMRAVFGVPLSQLGAKIIKRARRERAIDPAARWVQTALGQGTPRATEPTLFS